MIAGAALGLALTGVAAHGAFYRNSPVFGPVRGRLPNQDLAVALTFDDGPNPDATPRILDELARRDVRATFFVLGRHGNMWPELVSRIVKEGHALGNHGFYHRKLHFRSPAYVRRDLGMGTEAIERASGVRPSLFRAPHGFRSPWVTAIAQEFGQATIGWSLGVWDSDRPGFEAIANRTVVGARPGDIVLLHDGDGYDPQGDRQQTANAIPRILDGLRDRGYRFVPLAPA